MLPNDCKKKKRRKKEEKKKKKRRKKQKKKKKKKEINPGQYFIVQKKKNQKKINHSLAILLTNFQHVYYPNHEISNKRLQSHLQLHVRSILL